MCLDYNNACRIARPHRGLDSPPSAEQMLAIVGWYLPEEAAQGFAEAELAHPGSGPVLFTVRPDRWLTFDFTEEDES